MSKGKRSNKKVCSWYQELEAIDTASNHRKTIDDLWQAFIESEYADDKEVRVRCFILKRHFLKILK